MEIQIADIRIRVSAPTPAAPRTDYFAKLLSDFAPGGEPRLDVHLAVHFESAPEWAVEAERKKLGEYAATEDATVLADEGTVGVFRPAQNEADLFLGPGGKRFEAYLVNMLKATVCLFSARAGGIPLHCASLALEDRALLFLGKPSAGKTTIVTLARSPARVLCDECNVVYPCEERIVVHPTPFTTPQFYLEVCTSDPAMVDSVYILEKAPRNEVLEIAPEQSTLQILSSVAWFPMNSTIADTLMANMHRFAQLVRARSLRFSMAPGLSGFVHGLFTVPRYEKCICPTR